MSDTEEVEAVYVSRVASEDNEPIHLWFSLTYANYLTLPRSVLQSMPLEWQQRFVRCLEELGAAAGHLDWPRYTVSARNSEGRFIEDPIPSYNRGRTHIDLLPWREMPEEDDAGE